MSKEQHREGHLVIVGGAEDREEDMPILTRFVELADPGDQPLVVITAASTEPEAMWEVYRKAFADLGVKHCEPLHITSRDQANDPASVEKVCHARGVFMTGGDQKRLLALVGGTGVCSAMRSLYNEKGGCIGGTSAGASALPEHMLSGGENQVHAEREHVALGVGLGFISDVVVDQHFAERQRLSRLLSAIAHNPKLIGVGIDENTALIVHRLRGIEIVGDGAVTLMDGREMTFDFLERDDATVIQLADVRVHMVPAGTQHLVNGYTTSAADTERNVPPRIRPLVEVLCGH
ncbi:cyanophycinase [Caldimonas brevitalea]|uniref:Cyanophycinase n=1 Tax=Caldimonas brevitalea TaxID=413882 RepID=A0A0G3BDW2_9BURK|nr:cyanophycinase [Caldimonas brevitalea]AKJ27482.1 cyanophycinase [Caldimonas brevitalea]